MKSIMPALRWLEYAIIKVYHKNANEFSFTKSKVHSKSFKNDFHDGLKYHKNRKLGNMMVNCPLLKAKPDKFKRKKAMCTTWDDSKESILKKILKTKKQSCALWPLKKMSNKQTKMR